MTGNTRTFVLMAAMTALLMALGWLLGGRGGAIIALIFAGGTNVWAWWNSDKSVLRQHGAVPVTQQNGAQLLALVRQLADQAGLPMPAVYLLQTDQPNAFATGRDPQHAAVAVTQGLLRILNRDELAGVIAHELSHVRNRDTLIMTVTATLAGAIAMLGNMLMWTGGGDRRIGPLGGILMMILAPLAAGVVQMAISRTREFSADHGGAEITGRPDALASALIKIAQAAGRIPNIAAQHNPASASLFIINPLAGLQMDRMFATHPSTEERVARLRAMIHA